MFRSIFLTPLAALFVQGSLVAQESTPPEPEKQAWMRFVEDKKAAKLQTPIARYKNADGVAVDLIGAVHVGDREYYEELDDLFKTYDVILYELVSDEDRLKEITGVAEAEDEDSGKEGGTEEGGDEKAGDIAMSAAGALQHGMASALKLAHQVDVIDYTAKNFIHADMDPSMYKDKKKEKGETFMLFLIRAYKHQFELMRKGDTSGQIDIIEFFGNLFKHDAATAMKLAMARQLQSTEDMTAALEGENGSVILSERNKYALEVLRKTLPKGHRKIGIFYGAAHLEGMDKLLVEDFKFERTGIDWVTAWDIPLEKKKSGKRLSLPSAAPANP